MVNCPPNCNFLCWRDEGGAYPSPAFPYWEDKKTRPRYSRDGATRAMVMYRSFRRESFGPLFAAAWLQRKRFAKAGAPSGILTIHGDPFGSRPGKATPSPDRRGRQPDVISIMKALHVHYTNLRLSCIMKKAIQTSPSTALIIQQYMKLCNRCFGRII